MKELYVIRRYEPHNQYLAPDGGWVKPVESARLFKKFIKVVMTVETMDIPEGERLSVFRQLTNGSWEAVAKYVRGLGWFHPMH